PPSACVPSNRAGRASAACSESVPPACAERLADSSMATRGPGVSAPLVSALGRIVAVPEDGDQDCCDGKYVGNRADDFSQHGCASFRLSHTLRRTMIVVSITA